jgi:isoquinoline 1-oxidoreductase beta subunit
VNAESRATASASTVIQVERLSRRAFLVRAGSLAVSVAFAAEPEGTRAQSGKSSTRGAAGMYRPNAWVTIGADDIVTVISPASEMGQGVKTSLPLLVAEEMDADWEKIRILQAPADAKVFGNPNFGMLQITGGSQTTRGFYQKLRLVGAQTRKVILTSAATLMRVPIGELSTEPNIVVHAASGRRLSYGEIAKSARLPAQIATVTDADLKPPATWRYIGKSMPRVDIPSKVDGSAQFGIDVQLPGMLYGVVARSPVQDESIEALDDTEARAVPGLVKIVSLPYGVGVVADTFWAAQKARNALKVRWSSSSRARAYTSERVLAEFQAIANDLDHPGVTVAKRGDVAAAFQHAAKVLTANYSSDHVHHATMEPMNATALVSPEGVQTWGPFQAQTLVQFAAAKAAGTAPDKVSVTTMLLGGGFGRKGEADFAVDAVLLAKEVPGRAVKVIWTREDDVRHGKYRPLEAQNVRVALDARGAIVGWRHRLVADSIFARTVPSQFAKAGGVDHPVTEGIDLNYNIDNLLGEYIREDRGVDVGFWRSVGPGYTKFAVECMLDEVAASITADPLQLRLKLLGTDARAYRVVKTVAEMADWGRKRKGTALGLAYSDAFGAHCAQIAEVALDHDSGQIQVHNVWCTIDPGVAIQPENIVAQMESGIIHGLSHALLEKLSLVNGEVQESNFNSYRVMRLSEIPDIHVQVLASPTSPPAGIGEVGLPPVGPAVANGIAALTGGARLRRYPFVPDRVLAALKARNG